MSTCFTASNVFSQQLSIAYEDYLKAIGMEDDYIVMKNILKNGLMNRVEGKPVTYYEDNADFFSMVLLLSGVRPADYYKLEQNGIDIINAITADVRPFDEQSLLADLVVLGDVVKIKSEPLEGDGFDRTIYVEVSEILKGSAPLDTVKIRRRNSTSQSGDQIQPELNRSYLFLLSSGMYGYHKANHQFRQKKEIIVSQPQFGQEEVFLIYRLYPFLNGELYYSPQNTTAAFNSLQKVDYLLNQN
ncbi:MAG: hypothetical protein R3220_00620 [Balneolaceae bacterium]|nr:hypothetical protein [Balneolaceae bacterium]